MAEANSNFDIEQLLRNALAPVEPSASLSERMDTRLTELTNVAFDELAAWELEAMRDPRNWGRPAAAMLIGGAAATALVLVRAQLPVLEQRADGEQHPRRAETALEPGVPRERLLQPFEFRPLGQPLDRGHFATARVDGEVAARADRKTVDEHRARAADLDVARALGPGELHAVADHVEEELLGLDLELHRLAVEPRAEDHRASSPEA